VGGDITDARGGGDQARVAPESSCLCDQGNAEPWWGVVAGCVSRVAHRGGGVVCGGGGRGGRGVMGRAHKEV